MNKQLLLVTTLVAGMGLTGTAFADHALTNGDAETGDITGWTADPAVGSVASSATSSISPIDTRFFSTAVQGVGDGGSAALDQDVHVWGCGVEYSQGMYQVAVQYQTAGEDFADVNVTFYDALANLIGSVSDPGLTNTGAWALSTIGANTVPENAVTMNIQLVGTELTTAGEGNFADVGFDNASIAMTGCLTGFAKISGKLGNGRGSHSFSGSVGESHDSEDLVGTISINYKDLGESCVFTPTSDGSITYDNEVDGAAVSGKMDCEDGDQNVTQSLMPTDIYLVTAVESNNKNGDKHRGGICVDASGNDYDINNGNGTECTDGSNADALKNGNVWIDEDTSTVFAAAP